MSSSIKSHTFVLITSISVLGLAITAFAESPPVSAICIDADSGAVLASDKQHIPRPPASTIKIMLMLLVAEGMDEAKWDGETSITVSRHAQRMGGTQVFLAEGEKWPLDKLMTAVAVASANDAAMAVAEGLWGSKTKYLETANRRARTLGMKATTFNSVHGLPPSRGENPDVTTAHDMALLAKACVAHPTILEWTSQRRFTFRPDYAPYLNSNKLLTRMDNCDGLKTGFIRKAGFCLAATAKRQGVRVVCVVLGHDNSERRFDHARKLMEQGFDKLAESQSDKASQATSPSVATRKQRPRAEVTPLN